MNRQEQDQITSQVLRFHRTELHYSAASVIIAVVLEGQTKVKRFSRQSQFAAGDVFFVNSDEVWGMTSEEGCVVQIVRIPCALLPQISYPFANRIQLVDSLIDPDQTRDVSLIYRDCIFLKDVLEAYRLFNQDTDPDRKHLMEEKLVLTLTAEYNVQNEVNRQFRPVSEDKFVRYYRIIDYIQNHLTQKLTLQQAADAEKMQKSYFAQMWKQNDNTTFLECVSRCRLKESERQLLFTSASNVQISKACGFSDSKYFYRNFQNQFQMTPAQWKSCWMTETEADAEVLSLEEGLRYIEVQKCQLEYVKTDTRLYQQYLLLRDWRKQPGLKEFPELKLDLFHPDNVLIMDQQRILTWYGFDLLMRVVRQRQLPVQLQIRMECLQDPQELEEFKELISQVYLRFGTRITKNWKFELQCRNLSEMTEAEKLKCWFEKEMTAAKVLIVLL